MSESVFMRVVIIAKQIGKVYSQFAVEDCELKKTCSRENPNQVEI